MKLPYEILVQGYFTEGEESRHQVEAVGYIAEGQSSEGEKFLC